MCELIYRVLMTLLLTACTTDWMVLAQNSEIYFPGKTSTNTNSVHNVVADLNRNNVLSFLGQPLQVDLPQQTNPFQIGQPSIIDNARPLHSVPQPSNPERQGFVSANRNSQQSTHSPNIIRPDPNRQNSVPVTNRPLQSGIFLTNSPTNNQAPQFSTAPNTFGRQPSNSGSSVQQVHNTPTGRPSQTAFQYPASDESGDPYVAFATKLFTSSHTGTRNLVLSPILTQAALALLEIGASGHTRDDLSATVQSPLRAITHLTSSLKSINSQQTDIEYVSAVFVSNDGQLNRTFASVANEARSSVVPVNFRQPAQTVQIINSWVSQATRGAIPSIMDQNADTRAVEMLLANAIYFKSSWKYAFKTSEQGQFYKAKASSKPVTFIRARQYFPTGFIQASGQSGGAHWVEIPYAGEEFSMVILVPRFRDTLLSLISELSTSHVQTIINRLGAATRQLVDLKIPKFDIETRTSLVAALHSMGLGRLFATPSELLYVNEGQRVSVDDCIHSAKLAVDERGTIAAAANAFSIIPLSISPPDPEVPFIVDQPFLLLIVDNRNKYPLFIAKIFEP